MQYDRAVVLRTLQLIPEGAEDISLADERAAEQAAMAMDSLYIAYSKDAKPPLMPKRFARSSPNSSSSSRILRRATPTNLLHHCGKSARFFDSQGSRGPAIITPRKSTWPFPFCGCLFSRDGLDVFL